MLALRSAVDQGHAPVRWTPNAPEHQMSAQNSPLFQLQAARLRTRELRPDLSRTAFADPIPADQIRIRFTLFRNATDSTAGRLWEGHLQELAAYLTAEGNAQIRDKKRAPTMTQAVSADGRRKDEACAEITMLFGDADNVGDWDPLLAFLDSIGAAYVVHRSSSHGFRDEQDEAGNKRLIADPDICKWHLFIPITTPLRPQTGDIRRWKTEVYEPQYGWICGVLSELGRLHERTDCHPRDRKYGLDHSTSDLIAAAFVGRRLTADAPSREVRYSLRGGTLNWDRFLEVTGYHEARQAQAAQESAQAHPVVPPAPIQVSGTEYAPGEFAQRLRIALRACSLLGQRLDARRTYVLCPWRDEHSEGGQRQGQFDTSTVLYDADGGGVQFVCLHAHCSERDARTVWGWLREHHPDALPRRIIPQRNPGELPVNIPVESAAQAPTDAAPVPEMQTYLEQVWSQCMDAPPAEVQAYMQSAGFAAGADAAAGEVKYLPHERSAITAAGNARLRALTAKHRADPASLTVEEQIEQATLSIARARSQHGQIVYAVRRVTAALCGLILRACSDQPHPNHRHRMIGDCNAGLLGNAHNAQSHEAVLVLEEPDAYLLSATPGFAEGVTLYCVQADAYGPIGQLDLTGRRVYLTCVERQRAKQIARALRALPEPPADVMHAPPPRDSTIAAVFRRGISPQVHCGGAERIPLDPGSPTAPSNGGGDDLPQIVISTQIHENVQQAIAALAVLPEVYQRHGALVQIIEDNDPGAGVWRPRRAPEIKAISQDHLTEICARAARWFKVKTRKEGVDYEPAMPAPAVVGAVHSRNVLAGVRELKFITTTPTLRPDGTLIAAPGYDPSTGIVYMPAMQFEPVPDHPSEAQITQAVQDLLEVVCDFPFKGDAGRSAWLAALLTRLGRFTYDGPTPMFIVDANAPGTGKGLLVDTICLLADGKSAAKLRYAGDSDEDEKRIFSVLREGSPVAVFDNIDPRRELGHDALDQLLTADQYKGRVLGKSETPVYDNFTVWFATGNNVRLSGDTARRTIRITMRTDEEHPEERDNFRHPEPRTWILRNRTRLVSAALTLFRGWYAAGRPRALLKALGSFEAWTSTVRQICVWIADFCSSRAVPAWQWSHDHRCAVMRQVSLTDPLAANDEEHAESDERMIILPALLKGWAMLCADRNASGLPVSEALEQLRRDAESINGAPAPNKYRVLRETILELLPQRRTGDMPSPQNLAHLLRSYKQRVATVPFEDGTAAPMRFVNGHNGSRFWAAVRVVGAGVNGHNTTPHAVPVQTPVDMHGGVDQGPGEDEF